VDGFGVCQVARPVVHWLMRSCRKAWQFRNLAGVASYSCPSHRCKRWYSSSPLQVPSYSPSRRSPLILFDGRSFSGIIEKFVPYLIPWPQLRRYLACFEPGPVISTSTIAYEWPASQVAGPSRPRAFLKANSLGSVRGDSQESLPSSSKGVEHQ